MVDVVELKFPANVTLLEGAVQNWRDLPQPGPSAWAPLTPVVRQLDLSGDVIVVGPHDISFLRAVLDQAARVTIVTRAIPDAAEIGETFPQATVLCGSLAAAGTRVSPASAVIAAVDAALLQSTEEALRSWSELTQRVLSLAAPGAPVVLAIENERGLHRQNVGADLFVRETDADWSPLATWDESRPRSVSQVREALPVGTRVSAVLSQWNAPTALVSVDAPEAQHDLAVALSGVDHTVSALTLRSVGLARQVPDQAAGWLAVVGGNEATPEVISSDGRSIPVPRGGRTLQTEFIELATGYDLPGLRALLHEWWQWVQTKPAVSVDLANVVRADGGFDGLRPGSVQDPVAAAEDALSSVLNLVVSQGLSHPWPTSMHPVTRYCAVLAMAGVPRPTDARLAELAGPEVKDLSRDALLAVVRREQDELRSVWARAKWDEREYLTYRATMSSKKFAADNRKRLANAPTTIKTAPKRLKAVPRKVKKRFLG